MGFTILEPVADGINDADHRLLRPLGVDVRSRSLTATPVPFSNYDGVNGIRPATTWPG